MQKTTKKMLPLFLLLGCIALLGGLLAVLQLTQGSDAQEISDEIPLFAAAPEEITAFRFAGNSSEASLVRGSEGNWMLTSDPTLPLDQSAVTALAEQLLSLSAERQLSDSERGEIPPQSDTPAMRFAVTYPEGEQTLTVDALNDVANVYYVYDDAGTVYTVHAADFIGLTPTVRSLYAAQTLTDKPATEVSTMQVGALRFAQKDGVWTLTDEPDYQLNQNVVNKMARTICELETAWSITTPDADSAYGLDAPQAEIVLTFTDGSVLNVRYGGAVPGEENLCYLAADSAKGIVYEVPAAGMAAFAVTRESLAASEEATAETADTGNIIAEHPVGGVNDYADSVTQ